MHDCRLLILLIISCLCTAVTLSGQGYTTADNAEKRSLKRYEEALELQKTGKTAEAIAVLAELSEKDPLFIDAPQKLAEWYYLNQDLAHSAESFERVLALDTTYLIRNLYSLGRVYLGLGEYTRARQCLAAFLARAKPTDKLRENASTYLSKAEVGEALVAHPVPFNPQPIPGPVNTPDDEALPAFTVDGNFMFFTRKTRGQEDMYLSHWDSLRNQWSTPENLRVVNTLQSEGAHAVSGDGSMIAFTACGRDDGAGGCDIYFWQRIDGEWHRPVNAGGINDRAWDAQPALSPDGRAMYFSSERTGGYGGRDLWYTERHGDLWTRPVNLGPTINTPGDEEAPFLFFDGRTLYFMSDGHPGLGSADIFVTTRSGNTWSTPKNLGYPINTAGQEGAFAIQPNRKFAYYTSDKGGQTDLYLFPLDSTLLPPPVSNLYGRMVDAVTRKGLIGEVVIFNLADSTEVGHYTTDVQGVFSAVLPHGSVYGVHANAAGYVFWSGQFALDQKEPYQHKELLISLSPVPGSSEEVTYTPVVLRNIEFATGEATLLPSSIQELRRLLTLLESQAEISLEIRGHTDNVGSPAENLVLSRSRAEAVRDWLVGHGIAPGRIAIRGDGETRPIASNETEEGRQENRRVEFMIRR